jgi:hypothetical protein
MPPEIKLVEQDEEDAQVDPCGVRADVTVTVIQVLEISAIAIGTVGIHDHNHPVRVISRETPGPLVRLPPEAIIGDSRAKP